MRLFWVCGILFDRSIYQIDYYDYFFSLSVKVNFVSKNQIRKYFHCSFLFFIFLFTEIFSTYLSRGSNAKSLRVLQYYFVIHVAWRGIDISIHLSAILFQCRGTGHLAMLNISHLYYYGSLHWPLRQGSTYITGDCIRESR